MTELFALDFEQIFSSVYPRREFSSIPPQNASQSPGSTSKPTGNNLTKVLVGSVAIGACFYAAYSNGYLQGQSSDPLKVDNSNTEKLPKGDGGHDFLNIKEPISVRTSEDSETLNSHLKDAKDGTERQSAMDLVGDSGKYEGESDLINKNSSSLSNDASTNVKEEDLSKISDDVSAKGEQLSESDLEETVKDEYSSSQKLTEDSADMKFSGEKDHLERHVADEILPTITDVGATIHENNADKDELTELISRNETKVC